MRHSRPKGPQRAYTLIEVLVTVVILGIAAAVVVPKMGSRADIESTTAARCLVADLDLARSEAITRSMPVYVSFTPATTGSSYTVYKALPSTTYTHPVSGNAWSVSYGGTNFKYVQVTAANFDGRTILMFDETGAPYSCTSAGVATALSRGAVQMTCRGKVMTVSIEPLTGALSVQ